LNIINFGSFHTINIENLQSGNAVINMNVDMEKHTGDMLKISGSYNGSSLIGLTNIAPKSTQTSGDGLKLIEIDDAATGGGTFELAGGKWDAGGYEYMLYRGTEGAVGNDWYLRSTKSFSDAFKTMVNVPLFNNVLAETGMNSLQRRLGDLKNMGSRDNGIWARTHYKNVTINELRETDMRMFGAEAGYDRLIISGESNKIYAGIMLGYTKAEKIIGKKINGYYSVGEGESPSAGIYGTLINDEGWFIDLAARNFWTRLDMISRLSNGTELSFKPKRNIAALSAEAGKEIRTGLGEASYLRIEPKIEAEYMNASSGSAEVLNGVDDLSWDRTDYLSAKAAVLIGYAKKRKNGLLIEPLVELSYKHEFLGSGEVRYGGASYEVDLSGGVIEGNIGLNMQLTEALYWHALGGYEKGNKISGWNANAGIRYSFGRRNRKETIKDVKEYQDKIKEMEKRIANPLGNNELSGEKVISVGSSAGLKKGEKAIKENLGEIGSLYHAASYKFNVSSLDKAGKERVNDIIQHTIRKEKYQKLIVRGHTDNIGTYEVNKRISLMRAQSVASKLNKAGILNVGIIGEGYDKPIADNETKEGRAKNRRVDIEIIRPEYKNSSN
jgi:outer membrane autotransporter protein